MVEPPQAVPGPLPGESGIHHIQEGKMQRPPKTILATLVVSMALALVTGIAGPAAAQEKGKDKKPNIVFIMGDDIGWFNIGAYHQGIMAGQDAEPRQAGRRRACGSPTTTPRRAARRAGPTSSPASCRSAPA